MIIDFVLSYVLVLVTLVLFVGSVILYYFLDSVLEVLYYGNRQKLFNVWLLGLLAIEVHSIGHVWHLIMDGSMALILELAGALIGFFAMSILVKSTLSFYTFKKTKKQLEEKVKESAKGFEKSE